MGLGRQILDWEGIDVTMNEQEAIESIEYLKEQLEDDSPDMFTYTGAEINALNLAVQALTEIQQYREIGTVEECRAAVEKQKAKKSNYDDYHLAGYRCPDCNNVNPWGYKHCKHCGQKLDWSDEE